MKFAVAQLKCTLGDVPANCAQWVALAEQAKQQGCDAIVFPEMSDTGYEVATIQQHASPWPGLPYNTARETAKRLGMYLLCGMSERDGENIYNTFAVFNRLGELKTKYRKTHLFSPSPVCEHLCVTAGEEFTVVDIDGFKCGLLICYDLRFPELARTLTLWGAEVLIISSAWQFPRVVHWNTLLAARAIENQAYVIASNRVGTDGPTNFCGSSRIIDPYGVIVASAAEDRSELIIGEVTRETIEWVRGRMPVLQDRRQDLY